MTWDKNSRPEGTVRDLLDSRAKHAPNAVSHIFAHDGSTLTWAQLRHKAKNISDTLTAMGIKKGESVALCLPNSRLAILCLFGVFYGGFRATPLNLVAGPEALGYALSHSKSRFAFVGHGQAELFEAALRAVPSDVTAITVSDRINWPDVGDWVPQHDVAGNDHALLMYTSGTTGRPKGVLHSHAGLLAGGWNTSLAHGLTADDRALCVLPFFHINGLCVTLIAPLVSGGSVVVCKKFSNSRFWDQCAQFDVTWFSVVPTIISHILHSDAEPDGETIAKIRFGRSASSALAPEVHSAFEERFKIPIIETMGLTETAAQILSNPLPPAQRKIGSPGIAFGNEVAIIDEDLKKVANGASGEVAVRGPNVMLEYLDNAEATGNSFTADGWLRTGDLGHMDEDGYVFITGRLKELIIKGGENIAPREVDEALYGHRDVIEAAAFARPCPRYGQRVEAAVRLRPGSAVSQSELISLCGEKLGVFKSPDRIFVLDELPKGPSGKIQRMKLAEMTASEVG
ncbi:AMP-binding protein [Hoeflea sp. TYP-13]|uniref:AMP-binding protein n=1 Tax=Hoeflea sp. TYP-13 TaxID=3230023 RepID=UPI0034C603B1